MENKSNPTMTELLETILFEIRDKYCKYFNELEPEELDKKCENCPLTKI